MTNYEKLQYLDRLRDTIYPSREELYRMAVKNSTKLTDGHKKFFYSAINGNYIPLRFLGSGSFGVVFLCQDSNNNILAIKLAKMGKECERAACISELEISSLCKEKGVSCAIPYLNGTTQLSKLKNAQLFSYQPVQFVMPVGLSYFDFIFQYIQKKNGKLNSSEACFLIYNMFSVIEKIHEYDIVHRDIKPGNMMLVVTSSGKVQLMLSDFGTARSFEETGMLTLGVGSPLYIPVQIRKDQVKRMTKEDSKKQDVYATAVTAYQILDNNIKFRTKRDYEAFVDALIQQRRPRNCSDENLWNILKTIIHNSNNISRIPTAKEVCKALDQILFPGSGTSQRQAQSPKRPSSTRVYGGEQQTKPYSPNQPHGKKPTHTPHKPKCGNYGSSTPTVGFKPKQNNSRYGSYQEPEHKTRVAYGGKPQRGFNPKKGSGDSSGGNGHNGNGGAEPDIQDIINSLLK